MLCPPGLQEMVLLLSVQVLLLAVRSKHGDSVCYHCLLFVSVPVAVVVVQVLLLLLLFLP